MTKPRSLLSKVPAVRLEQLYELYAPIVERADGSLERDPAYGVITHEQFVTLINARVGPEPD